MSTRLCAKKTPKDSKQKPQKPVLPEDIKAEMNLKLPVKQPNLLSNLSIRMIRNQYWQKVIAEVEHSTLRRNTPQIKILNHTDVLPPIHKKRVQKIMLYEHSDTDDRIYFKKDLLPKRLRKYGRLSQIAKEENREESTKDNTTPYLQPIIDEKFNESDYSSILQKERDFKPFILKIDKPINLEIPNNQSWMTKYLAQTNKQRIIWNTKTYLNDPEVQNKNYEEQGEELIDITATRFIDWLNKIGSGVNSQLTISELKKIFGLKIEQELAYSMNDKTKELKVIPGTVADIWNMPDSSIEHHYEEYLNSRRETKPRILSAFGRTIPPENRSWIRHFTDHRLTTAFPEEIMTLQRMFRGILDLQSISYLVQFYVQNPRLEKPKYLVRSGVFDEQFARNKIKIAKEQGRLGKNTLYGKLGLDYLRCDYSKK